MASTQVARCFVFLVLLVVLRFTVLARAVVFVIFRLVYVGRLVYVDRPLSVDQVLHLEVVAAGAVVIFFVHDTPRYSHPRDLQHLFPGPQHLAKVVESPRMVCAVLLF